VAFIGRLPVPTTEAWDWQVEAACRGMASSFFFHPWGERGPSRDERVRRAKEVCAACPVLEACRQHALDVQEQYGVWGGLSEEERMVLLNRGRRSLRKKVLAQSADLAGLAERMATQPAAATP
jgi:WhiB family redox-sensing transcriptional regulator